MSDKKNIYESIAGVMADISAVGKTSKNQQQGFMYRGIDAVMNALSPALVKNRVFVVPKILNCEREERTSTKGGALFSVRCTIEYDFFAEDGSSISAVVIGEGMDSGDKATNKAMSIAFKYACFQVFCIPTEEMADPDAECHEVTKKAEPTKAETDQGNKKISATHVKALKSRMEKDKIPEKLILELYKVGKIEDIDMKQYTNINDYWERIQELAKK